MKAGLREHPWIAAAIALGIVVTVIAIALKVSTTPYSIPTGSMEPTLQIGDRVATDKTSDPARGDIAVLDDRRATQGFEQVIRRVIAFGGETVTIRNGSVYIDGRRLEEPYLAAQTETAWSTPPPRCDNPTDAGDDVDISCLVPEGSLFVLADNRSQGQDSRQYGPVAADSVKGTVFWVYWPLDRLGRP